MSTKDLRRELGRKELFGIACGNIIGSGIMILVGTGIGITGRSVNLAFVLAAIFVVLSSIPMLFMTNCVRLRGGEYTQGYMLCGPKFAGFWTIVYSVRNITLSVYALSFADYVLSLFPNLPHKVIAIVVATAFFVLNVFPTKYMAKVQNLMMVFLIAALVIFVIWGWNDIQPGYFENDLTTDGLYGFTYAAAFLTFAVMGANGLFQLGGECKNPKRDIPFVFIVSTLSVAILYALIATVAAGVLPIDQVANQNLSVVAQKILPKALYLFFIIGGAWCAIATTLNANIAWVTKPLIQAAEDGWIPKKLATLHPKFKTPVYLLAVFYIITIVPILTDISLENLANLVLVMQFVMMIFTSIATIKLPKLLPEEWAASPFKCSQGLLTFFCVLATIVLVIQAWLNFTSLTTTLKVGQIGFIIVAYLYAHLRYKSGKVKMTVSYDKD